MRHMHALPLTLGLQLALRLLPRPAHALGVLALLLGLLGGLLVLEPHMHQPRGHQQA